MSDDTQQLPTTENQSVTRRRMLAGVGAGGGARAAPGPPGPAARLASAEMPKSARNPTEPDPKNPPLHNLFPESFNGPASDHGDVKPFWYSFEIGRNKISDAGWARQVTARDLPISTDIAGVNMRLNKGAVRELHWHQSAEWAYMLTGTARVTGVDQEGRAFVGDIGPGDLWIFPSGIAHSIQGTGDDGCEFILVFDDGMFSEFETFLITDWMAHTPREVLAKNFGLPESAFDVVPKEELYIFNAPLPGSLESDEHEMIGDAGPVESPYTYALSKQKPDVSNKSGEVKIVDSTKFKASTAIAAAQVTLRPGGLRELHWHPNADEWQYWVKGQGRMTVFTGGGKARTMDFRAGDVGYIPNNLPHYIENTGDTDLVFLETFKADQYQDISLVEWITHLPATLVKAHLGIDKDKLLAAGKGHQVVVPA
jgi:oxalate decarboxylase